MKAAELREMSDGALADKLKELHHETFNLRFQHATAQLENTARIRVVRKDIARINTIMAQRSATVREG